MRTKQYDPKEFVKVWQTAPSPEDAAKKLSFTKEKTVQLASILRRKGIPLKTMKKGPNTSFDVAELTALAKKYEKHASHQLN